MVGNPEFQNLLSIVVDKTNKLIFHTSKFKLENPTLDLFWVIIDHNHQ